MSFDSQKQEALRNLYSHRDHMEDHLNKIESILQIYFPEEFAVFYQHWFPQIKTALRDDTKWLPRGQYSMDYTLNRLNDKVADSENKGVSKYIK
jgi:hypothetical protein